MPSNGRNQTFIFAAPSAKTVQLVGDFTEWEQRPIAMKKGADGVWKATLDLAPGEHFYRFLVDGQWRDDPECMQCKPNPYGSKNAVRQVA